MKLPTSHAMGPLSGETSSDLADLAVRALLGELETYPKPGLVSQVDSGAHHDMDHRLLARSAGALRLPLKAIAAAGANDADFDEVLAPLGREAEERMLQATHGVNTHRGAIFCLGLLVAAAALLGVRQSREPTDRLRRTLLERWGPDLARHAACDNPDSNGGRVRRQLGITGARAEAARGFPRIFECGLPALRQARRSDRDENRARVAAFFALLAVTDDSNLAKRGGRDGLTFARSAARRFLADGGVHRADWQERAIDLHHQFTRRNLSPGGTADLLAGTLFVDSLRAAHSRAGAE